MERRRPNDFAASVGRIRVFGLLEGSFVELNADRKPNSMDSDIFPQRLPRDRTKPGHSRAAVGRMDACKRSEARLASGKRRRVLFRLVASRTFSLRSDTQCGRMHHCLAKLPGMGRLR